MHQEALSTSEEQVIWVAHASNFKNHSAAKGFIDLLFEATEAHIQLLAGLLPKPVVVNRVADTLENIHPQFVRINGWAPFLSAAHIEAAGETNMRAAAENIFAQLGKTMHWLPDDPGFVRARVVAMIINEAYLALEEGVSTKAEINAAMKLGTAYPLGPFEWAERIGVKQLVSLLQKLARQDDKYTPAQLMLAEAE